MYGLCMDTPKVLHDDTHEHCHFWDAQAEAGKNPNKTCQGQATQFIRKNHDKRLCPLCPSCKETFVRARAEMTDEVKKSIPGAGEFTDVTISPESIAEYRAQPSKKVATTE